MALQCPPSNRSSYITRYGASGHGTQEIVLSVIVGGERIAGTTECKEEYCLKSIASTPLEISSSSMFVSNVHVTILELYL